VIEALREDEEEPREVGVVHPVRSSGRAISEHRMRQEPHPDLGDPPVPALHVLVPNLDRVAT